MTKKTRLAILAGALLLPSMNPNNSTTYTPPSVVDVNNKVVGTYNSSQALTKPGPYVGIPFSRRGFDTTLPIVQYEQLNCLGTPYLWAETSPRRGYVVQGQLYYPTDPVRWITSLSMSHLSIINPDSCMNLPNPVTGLGGPLTSVNFNFVAPFEVR